MLLIQRRMVLSLLLFVLCHECADCMGTTSQQTAVSWLIGGRTDSLTISQSVEMHHTIFSYFSDHCLALTFSFRVDWYTAAPIQQCKTINHAAYLCILRILSSCPAPSSSDSLPGTYRAHLPNHTIRKPSASWIQSFSLTTSIPKRNMRRR